MAVRTFLHEYDFSGKSIVLFCTHEGSGLGNSKRDITKLCPTAEIVDAIAFQGARKSLQETKLKNGSAMDFI